MESLRLSKFRKEKGGFSVATLSAIHNERIKLVEIRMFTADVKGCEEFREDVAIALATLNAMCKEGK